MILDILHLSDWMCPEHCTPDFWFRWFVILSGTYIAGTYLIFSYQVLIKLRGVLTYLLGDSVPKILGLVFVLCAITHGLHGYAYINQYTKLGLLISYPILVFLHTMLIRSSRNAIKRIATIKNIEDLEKIELENKKLKKKVALYESAVAKTIYKKDISILKKIIQDEH